MAEYTDARLEHLLSAAIDRATPDLREQAATTPVERLTATDELVPSQRRRVSPLRAAAMSLAACLVLVLGLGSYAFFRPLSVIGIDVNPSIELTVNHFDRILEVTPLNDEAVSVIGDMDLKYVDLDIAVNALVGSMALHGYFESGQNVAVLVSVTGGSEAHNNALQKKLALDIEAAAATAGASAAVYTQNTDKDVPPPQAPPAVTPTATPTAPSTPSVTPSPSPLPTPDVPAVSPPATAPVIPPPAENTTSTPAVTPPAPSPSPRPATAQERAAQNGISYGKQVFIDKLLALDPTLNEGELVAMPIGKISALVKQKGLDLSSIVDYDPEDSPKENIEDFIDDIDDGDDGDDDDKKNNNGNHNGWDKKDSDDDDDDDDEDDD